MSYNNPFVEFTWVEEDSEAPRPVPGMVAVLYPDIACITFIKPGYISHCTPDFPECEHHDRPVNREDLVDYLRQLARTHGLRLKEDESVVRFK